MQRAKRPEKICAKIGPSVLNADLSKLHEESVKLMANGADYLHLDVMDGHFVPNITFGHPVIQCLTSKMKNVFFETHMMVSNPDQWIEEMSKADVDQYTFHIEASKSVTTTCRKVRESGMKIVEPLKSELIGAKACTDLGVLEVDLEVLSRKHGLKLNAGKCKVLHIALPNAVQKVLNGGVYVELENVSLTVGIALKPGTSVQTVAEYIDIADMILIMTVEPGFGGQKFMQDMMTKVKWLRDNYPLLDIEVDGGVGPSTILACAEAGANFIVSGTGIIKAPNQKVVIDEMRNCVQSCIEKQESLRLQKSS